jgi:para-nitrobenzyl esterase
MNAHDWRIRWAAAALLGVTASVVAATPVRVEQGLLESRLEEGIDVYRGVPFAAPPTGALRWRPPQPAPPWSGVRAARSGAPSCMQPPQLNASANETFSTAGETFSEDCLYLNIWAPHERPGRALPVMVWIHGGGFIEGSPNLPTYDGANLARHGVIVVNAGYRLGPFGFLALPQLSAESPQHVSGNYGLLDQIAALLWVRHNIAAFGGDPARVTIFGQSAGGIAVSMLAASPLAKGLFQGVIAESGGSFGPVRVPPRPGENMQTLSDAEHTGTRFVQKLPATSLEELRKLPAQAIQSVRFALNDFWPAQDGWVILDDQHLLYEQGRYNDTPVLIGSNSDEGALFPPRGTAASFIAEVHERFGPFADELLKVYPATESAWQRSSMDLTRDAAFAWHTLAWAQLQARAGKSKVFTYYFAHVPPRSAQSRYKDATGAVHGEELPYVFGTLARQNLAWSATDRALSEQMMTFWTNFAERGDPNGPGLPAWPAFDGSTQQFMRFEATSAATPVPNAARLHVLDRYYAWRRSPDGAAFGRRAHE